MNKTLEKYLAELRRIESHRSARSERRIRKLYKGILDNLRSFLGVEYATLAESDKLTYELLQRKGEYARFLEEIDARLSGITPEVSRELRELVTDTYELAYIGMIEAVEKASGNLEALREELVGLKTVSPEVVKVAVENPIAGLTLADTLERNRKEIVYNIKRAIGVGLINGDRMTTMASRFKSSLNEDYKKSIRIARTEAHRIREAGHGDAAREVDSALSEGTSGMRMVKTWRSMSDERVRKTNKADHKKMDGAQVGVDEYFDLGRGVKTLEPGNSGDAANDINCRCYVSYDLVELKMTK